MGIFLSAYNGHAVFCVLIFDYFGRHLQCGYVAGGVFVGDFNAVLGGDAKIWVKILNPYIVRKVCV